MARAHLIILFLAFAATIPCLHAGWAKPDDYVVEREQVALKEAAKAYHPDPEAVTEKLNTQVGQLLDSQKNLRRQLAEGECRAPNPIDRCWRCDKHWANNRKRLADCALGFARGVTGGKDGEYYVVTDPSDNDLINPKEGTLRHAVTRNRPLWIVFKHSMVITLREELLINSNKTIDGRGNVIRIAYGSGLTVAQHQNVIIHNIRIHNIHAANGADIRDSEDHWGTRTRSDGDGISLFTASNVWIDHVSLGRCADGLIDAIQGSTAITISNCKFNYHNDVMLLGAHDGYEPDKLMQVTVAFNKFGHGLVQRMPRCRSGFFHVVNNDYSNWEMYAIGGSSAPTIVSQGNRFRAGDNRIDNNLSISTKEVTHRDYATEDEWKHWQWRSEGDLFLNGAFFVESGEPLQKTPLSDVTNIQYLPGSSVGALTRNAGALRCRINHEC